MSNITDRHEECRVYRPARSCRPWTGLSSRPSLGLGIIMNPYFRGYFPGNFPHGSCHIFIFVSKYRTYGSNDIQAISKSSDNWVCTEVQFPNLQRCFLLMNGRTKKDISECNERGAINHLWTLFTYIFRTLVHC